MITINGKKVPFKEGKTVLETALDAGIYVPSLCTHPELEPFGACRLCIVKIEGMRGFPTSCTTLAHDGMVIITEDDELQKMRRTVLELLLSEHPNTCIICEDKKECEECHFGPTKAGRVTGCTFCSKKEICEVREIADYLEIKDLRLPFEYKNLPLERDDPFFDRDYNLCILCGRCVRVCHDIRGRGTLAFTQRSHRTKVGTAFDKPHIDSECGFCGACIDVCPTGALSARGSKWYGDADRCTDSTCLLCSVGCTFSYESKWNRVMGAIPKRDGPTKGQACSRGRFCIPQLFNGPDRLKQPMIRKNGKLIPVNWNEAIEYVAEKLKQFTNGKIGVGASPSLTNESAYTLQKFARTVLKTNNIDYPNSDIINPIMDAVTASNSAISNEGKIKNLEKAKWIIILGRKIFLPSSALNPSIYRAKKKGAKIILIDNKIKAKTPRIVDINLKFGAAQTTDLFYGIIYKLLNDNPNLAKDHANYSAFAKSVKKIDINRLGKDVSKEVEKITKVISKSKGCVIFDQEAVNCSNPEKLVSAIMNILILSGNPEGFIPYYDGGNIQGIYDMGATLLNKKGKSYSEMLNGGVKALYLTEAIPEKQLKKIEFLILQDIYPSKTMDKADVVLPACAFTEDNGTVTSLERRIQKVKKAVDGPGIAQSDWKIICEIAKKMGAKDFDYKNHQNIFNEIKDVVPFISGTGVWSLKNNQLKLIPLTTEKIKELPSTKPLYYYRGANLIERVDDFRLQIEKGGT